MQNCAKCFASSTNLLFARTLLSKFACLGHKKTEVKEAGCPMEFVCSTGKLDWITPFCW